MTNQNGTSFIEAIVYVAIISMVMIAFMSYAIGLQIVYNKAYLASEAHASMRLSLDILGDRLRESKSIDYAMSDIGVNPGSLYLRMYDVLTDPVIFSLNGENGQLYISEGGGAPIQITTNELAVTELIFNRTSSTTSKDGIGVKIKIEALSDSKGNAYEQEVNTAYTIR